MRSFAVIFLFSVLFVPAITQTTKPKQTTSKTPVKKPTLPKPNTARPKPTPQKSAAKPKTTSSKPTSSTIKPKQITPPKPKIDETAEWEKALATADAFERIGQIKKFLAMFPKTKRRAEALEALLKLRADIGNERLLGGDLENAAKLFKAAALEAPVPISDQLFTETLAKFPANLYFRGSQEAALDIAKTIAKKITANPDQLITIANFYLSIENGEEAKRVAENVIKIAPTSTAFQTLALADRIEFRLDESAAAYSKALELDPESLIARRGLAEMKRALGKSDEAITLYKEILAKDEANAPAKTGLILAMFDAGKRADAETELKTSLDANAGNVILLAGAAYWYASNNQGDKAVEFGQRAVDTEPRYIWSHIALARGLLLQDKPLEAEKILMAARRYGNFPTLEYEIATMRAAAGLYREAAESLEKMFVMKDGQVATDLGLRVPVQADTFYKLIQDERRASIFTPTSADTIENSARLRSLFEFSIAVNASDASAAIKFADSFVAGDDTMKTHRLLFTASQLLAKKIEPNKVLELTKAAVTGVEASVNSRYATVAVLADEIYQPRTLAAARSEYIQVPNVPQSTLLAIVRGRIEEMTGSAFMQLDNMSESLIRFKRAIGVLPTDSAWWRSTMWHMGAALEASGKPDEALEAYAKSYRSGMPDPIKYSVIESLYKRTKGNTEGLELKIGRNPLNIAEDQLVVSQNVTPTPTPDLRSEPTPIPNPTPVIVNDAATVETTLTQQTVATVSPTPESNATPKSLDDPQKVASSQTPTPTPIPFVTPTPEPVSTPVNEPSELFPPVVITIPSAITPTPTDTALAVKSTEEMPSAPDVRPRITSQADEPPSVKPCVLTVSEPSITLQNSGSELALILGTATDEDTTEMKAMSDSPSDIDVKRQEITAIRARALFVVRSISSKLGLFQVSFSLPCGKIDVEVRVR